MATLNKFPLSSKKRSVNTTAKNLYVPPPPYTITPASPQQSGRHGNALVPMSVGPYLQTPGCLGYSGVPVVTGHAGPFIQTPPVMVQPQGYMQGFPGGYVQSPPSVKPPSTHRKLSICGLCCFFPIAVVAIYYSYETDAAIRRMDYYKAKSKSRIALILSLVCIVNGFIFYAAISGCMISSSINENDTHY